MEKNKLNNSTRNKIKINNKMLVLGASLLLILIAVCIMIFVTGRKVESSKFNYKLAEKNALKIKNCYDENNCWMKPTDYYYTLVVDGDYPALQKKVDKINKDTKNDYENAKSSVTETAEEGDSCYDVKDIFYHRYSYSRDYYAYETKDLVSVAVQRKEYSLCDDEVSVNQVEAYIYDKKTDKIISQEEFKKREKITDKEVRTAIEALVDFTKNQGIDTSLYDNYDNIILFYGSEGEIFVSFEIAEMNGFQISTVRPAPSK